MTTRLIAGVGLALIAVPLAAQDAPLIDFNGALNDARVTGRMVRQAQGRERARVTTKRATTGQAAACAQKVTFRKRFGARNAKVQQLYSLCRGVGL